MWSVSGDILPIRWMVWCMGITRNHIETLATLMPSVRHSHKGAIMLYYFFTVSRNKLFNKQPSYWWFETNICVIRLRNDFFNFAQKTHDIPEFGEYSLWMTFFDDVISQMQTFPRYWPFAREIHRSSVNSPHKGQWRGTLMFSLTCARINAWVNNGEVGDLRRHRAHYDVIVMQSSTEGSIPSLIHIVTLF